MEDTDSVDIFQDSSQLSLLSNRTPSSPSVDDINASQEYLDVDGIRIYPPKMSFENAYDGKLFKRKLIIQNYSFKTAFIRLLTPTSKTFEFKTFENGHHLSPGLKIVRTVTYMCRTATAIPEAFTTIIVNDKEIDYHFSVSLSEAVISVEPQLLDFGQIDAVNVATMRKLQIKNTGHKGTHFAIDLGRNELELIVEPMKGSVPAKSSVTLYVEIVGLKEGDFMNEFWIKTTPPRRVLVSGTFISPKLLVRKFIHSLDFTMMEFRPTYYGSRYFKPLLVKNFSSTHSMFYVMAEVKGAAVPLQQAKDLDENYKHFVIHPEDGRLFAEKGAMVQISFSPIKTLKKEKDYAACFLKIIRLDCRDIDFSMAEDDTKEDRKSKDMVASVRSNSKENFSSSNEGATALYDDFTVPVDTEATNLSFEYSLHICLHGEKETPGVYLKPNFISINDLTLNDSYIRVVSVKNKSSRLPIRVSYSKIPSVKVQPHEFDLRPNRSLEVKVIIRPFKFGTQKTKITFDLLAKDFPSENIFRKVGSTSMKIEFQTNSVVKNKRLDQCLLCYDLAAKLEPEFPFRPTPSEQEKKLVSDNYYLMYIRSLKKNKKPLNQKLSEVLDYDLTNAKLLMYTNVECKLPPRIPDKIRPYSKFIPLIPRQLYNIKVSPKSIRLRKVAALTSITESFRIENLNPFPVHIYLKSSKPCITFENSSRYLLEAGEKRKIPFFFSSTHTGRYYVNMDVVINESSLFEVTVVAYCAPKTLQLENTQVIFEENDGHYKFFKLINLLNAYTNFEWEMPEGCFKIFPDDGCIPAEHTLLSVITYEPDPGQPDVCECTLTSESGLKQIVQISYKNRHPSVIFDTDCLDCGIIPLNLVVKKKLIMKNVKNFKITFKVPHCVPVPGIEIYPNEGMLDIKDNQIFDITIQLSAVIQFDTHIVFNIDEAHEFLVQIKGIVDFPLFSLKPDMLYFRKISPYSFDTLAFKVKNMSKCDIDVKFPLEDFPEFSITEDEDIKFPHQRNFILKPEEAKILFLHFHPDYISTYSFYLPCIINDIFGPMHLNSPQTTTPVYYLQENEFTYDHTDNIEVIKKYPKKMNSIRVNCCAVDKSIEFSSLNLNFTYFGENHYNNCNSGDFEITNVSNETVKVCIRTDELVWPFSLIPKGDSEVDYYDISYLLTIKEGETVLLEASFTPEEQGEYSIKLPIFLRHYHDNKIFNYLTISGVYGKPTITSSIETIYFEPIPNTLKNELHLTIHLANHFGNCEIQTMTNLNGLFAIFERGRTAKPGECDLPVVLHYCANRTICIDTTLLFYCPCGSSCEVIVRGVSEDCLLTTHAFSHLLKEFYGTAELMSMNLSVQQMDISNISSSSIIPPNIFENLINYNTTTYPDFPQDTDESPYAIYMRKLQKTVENWVYSQGFFKTSYYKIPEGFIYYIKAVPSQKKQYGSSKKMDKCYLPIVQLIDNLVGHKIRDEISPGPLEADNEMDELSYVCSIYTNLLKFLRSFPVYLPAVEFKYLLNYEQYSLYENLKNPKSQKMSEAEFYLRSKQCWIDLILQIIKTLVLFRIRKIDSEETVSNESSSDVSSVTSIPNEIPRPIVHAVKSEEDPAFFSSGIYGNREIYLIKWLEKSYVEQKNDLWPNEDLGDRKVILLYEDLKDGILLGCVTASYCPYIKDMIKNMFPKPQTPEEEFHNTCTLIQTWQTLKLSYEISPFFFDERGTMVEMLLLLIYLYEVLPNYQPKETTTIRAPLTQTNSECIEIHNCGYSMIVYQAIFFNNEKNLFQVPNQTIKVPPGKKIQIKIEYFAKWYHKAISTLVLCGETSGQKYGKSLAVTLIGIADVSYICKEIPITVQLYKPCEVTFDLESPYKVKAEYKIYFGSNIQVGNENPEDVLFPWNEIKHLRSIKDCVFTDSCQFNEEGKRTGRLQLCCMQSGERRFWAYYVNSEVGDWGTQIICNGKVTEDNFERITVKLPQNYENLKCMCKNGPILSGACPKIIKMKIPKINTPLWNARKTMVLQQVRDEEFYFWEKRIFTPLGTRILTLLLNSETHPLKQTVEETVEYGIVLEKNCPFITLESIVIDDITSEDCFELPIHPIKSLTEVQSCVVRLIAKSGPEKRFYRIFFNSDDKQSSEREIHYLL